MSSPRASQTVGVSIYANGRTRAAQASGRAYHVRVYEEMVP